MTVGERIKRIRTFRHMTMEEFGNALGFEGKSASVEYVGVSLIHLHIAYVHTFGILIEGVVVLHDEISGSHHAVSGTRFISELVSDLIKHEGQLSV